MAKTLKGVRVPSGVILPTFFAGRHHVKLISQGSQIQSNLVLQKPGSKLQLSYVASLYGAKAHQMETA